MFWNQEVETLSRADMTSWQNYKLTKMMERVYEKSSLYSQAMTDTGLRPEDISTVEDLAKLPYTTHQHLASNYPYGLLTMPISGVSYIHRGQEGKELPTAMSYTQHDMAMWTELMSRMLVGGGVNKTTVFQVSMGNHGYSGCLGVGYGVRQIGAALVSSHTESIIKELDIIQDFGVNGIFSTPDYLLHLADCNKKIGNASTELPFGMIFCGIQSLNQVTREKIKQVYGIQPLEIYGLDSVFGMGIGSECHYADGLHLQEDCFFPEIIDPATGELLALGKVGELVLTSLTLEAMPILRYRTGTLGHLDNNPCHCGRTLVRFHREK